MYFQNDETKQRNNLKMNGDGQESDENSNEGEQEKEARKQEVIFSNISESGSMMKLLFILWLLPVR